VQASGFCPSVRKSLIPAIAALLATIGWAAADGQSSSVEIFRPTSPPGYSPAWNFSTDMVLGSSRLVVGSYQPNLHYPWVHVYVKAGGAWQLEQVVTFSPSLADIDFGCDVALSEDERTLFVGASYDGSPNHGSVHIFHRDDTLGWTPAGKLMPPDGLQLDHFGGVVDVSGDHLAVAAYRTDSIAFDGGSIYMFKRQSNGTWLYTQKIELTDAQQSDLFGNQICIEGDLLVASTVTRDIDGFADQGLVQTYQRDPASGQWIDIGRLTAHDGSPTDYFGSALALSGNRLAVGAYGRGVPKAGTIAQDQGSVYIYERDSGHPSGWRFINLIKNDDGAAGDWFGRSVDFDGEILVVGAPRKKNGSGTVMGAAYAFLQNGAGIANSWRQVHKFNPVNTSAFSWFGDAVAISSTDLFVGARLDRQVSFDQGSVSRFHRGFDLTVPVRNHDQWLKSHFTEEELLDPASRHTRWGAGANPDGDALSNAAEYFAGGHPLVADSFSLQPSARFSGKNLTWTLPRSADSTRNAVPYISSGDNLQKWRRRDETTIGQTSSEQTLTLPNYKTTAPRQFFRVDYEMP
jgi:hypothetical protein